MSATRLIRAPVDDFSPHAQRDTEQLGECETARLRLASAYNATTDGMVRFELDAEIARYAATAVREYSALMVADSRRKVGGARLNDVYQSTRLDMLAHSIYGGALRFEVDGELAQYVATALRQFSRKMAAWSRLKSPEGAQADAYYSARLDSLVESTYRQLAL